MGNCENMNRTIQEEDGPGEDSYGKVLSRESDRAIPSFEYGGFTNDHGVP